MVAGLLGGIASGKSTVARLFAELGAAVLDADALAHRCLEEPAVVRRVAAEFGDDVLASAGGVDRKRLAARAFASPARRAALEAIVHPCVLARLRDELLRARAPGGPELVVLDVPLLLESELNALCDARVFVDAPRALRDARARSDRGWDPGELERREKFQRSVEEKSAAADYRIANDGSLEPLRDQVRETFHKLVRSNA